MKVKVDANGKITLSKFDRLLFRFEFALGKAFQFLRLYKWRAYDPSWLVALAQEQFPQEKALHAALGKCSQASGDIPYIHFVSPRRANKPNAEWQFARNVTLEDPKKGELILDVLKDGRIGGVEFLGILLGAS